MVYPPLDATLEDITICESPSAYVNLTALMTPQTTVDGVWTVVSTSTGITANMTPSADQIYYTIASNATQPYTITVRYTLTSASNIVPCATTFDEATITISGTAETGTDLPDAICAGDGAIDLNDYTALGTGTWTLVTTGPGAGTLVGSIYTPDPNFDDLNLSNGGSSILLQFNYQPAAGGCGMLSSQFMTVHADVDATLDPVATNQNDEFCLTSTDLPFDLTILYNTTTTSGGVWTSWGADPAAISGTVFNPSIPGTYILTYGVANGTCSDSDSYTVIIYPNLNATVNNFSICESPSGLIDLTALWTPTTNAGGTWTVLNDMGIFSTALSPSGNLLQYTIDPGAVPPYTITVRYTLTSASNTIPCATTFDDATITITAATETGFDLPDSWCAANGDLPLNPYTTNGGGVWTVTMVGGNSTDPILPYSVSGPNATIEIDDIAAIDDWFVNAGADSAIVAIHYQPAPGGCGIPITEVIQLYEDVSAAWTAQPVCMGQLPLDLDIWVTGTPGGTWSGTGVSPDGTFNPGVPGLYSITYTVGFGPCAESEIHDIQVYPVIQNLLDGPIEVCESPSGTVNLLALLAVGTPNTGTWTLVSDNFTITPTITNNVLNYQISFADVSPYIITVEYDLDDSSGLFPEGSPCNPAPQQAQVIIHGATEIGFDLPDTWCVSDGVIDLTNYTAMGGGIYSLVTNPEVSIGTTYTPANGDGLVGILYTPAPGGCGMPHVEFIDIIDSVSADWVNPVVLCEADLPYMLEPVNQGGTWSGAGVNPITGMFGVYQQYKIMDFDDGTVVFAAPAPNQNNIYAYTENGMNISTTNSGSAANYFRWIQTGGQTDIQIESTTSTGLTFALANSGNFDLTRLSLDQTLMSGGFTVTGYDALNTIVGTQVIPENTNLASPTSFTFPVSFANINYFTITFTGTGFNRARIEEIEILDNTEVVPPGFYPITYTLGDEPCADGVTYIIEVKPERSTIIRDIVVCQSPSGTIDLTAMFIQGITTQGGTFVVVGDNLAITPYTNNNTLNYQISFTDVPPYQITIVYDLPSFPNMFDPGPCNPSPDTAIITIVNTTETGFDLPSTWCVSDGAINLPLYTQIGGGTYALLNNPATAIDESEIPLAGNVYIPQNGDGLVGITYTPQPNGCSTPHTEFIQIINQWTVDIANVATTPPNSFCPNADPYDLSVSVVNSVPYPIGTVMTYIPNSVIEIPAGTTVMYSGAPFVNVQIIEPTTGAVIAYPANSAVTYAVNTTVFVPNGATLTYTAGATSSVSPMPMGTWSGTGIINSMTGLFDPEIAGLGTHTIYFTVMNGLCANKDSIQLFVGDNTPPVPVIASSCGDTIVRNTISCSAFATVPAAMFSDNCPGSVVVSYIATNPLYGVIEEGIIPYSSANGIYPTGNTTITWLATDAAGNQATCQTVVRVVDNIPPFISCAQACINATTSPTSCDAEVLCITTPSTYDNCAMLSSQVTYTALHTIDVTGAAIVPPTVLALNATGSANGTYPGGTTLITWTATDLSGNTSTCSTSIVVADDDAPVFVTCSDTVEVSTFPGTCQAIATWIPPIAIDNCSEGIDPALLQTLSDMQDALEEAEDLLDAADNAATQADADLAAAQTLCAGNPSTVCIALIAAETMDSTAAHNNLVATVALYNQALADYNAVLAAVQAAAASAGLNYTSTHTPGSVFNLGSTTVTYIAEDASGNTSACSFTVLVRDLEPPVITCATDSVFAAAPAGSCETYVPVPPPTYSDNCGGTLTLINDYNMTSSASGTYVLGETTVVWTVTDASGNTATCSTVVVVEDVTPPAIQCPANITIGALPGLCSANAIVGVPIVSDVCSSGADLTVVNSYNGTGNASDSYPVGTTFIVWTATDAGGNTSTCGMSVRVLDTQVPTIVCPTNIQVQTDPNSCTINDNTATVTVPVPTTADNCAVASITNSFNGTDNASGVYPVGVTSVVWTVLDVNGNQASCTMTVTVIKCCLAEAGAVILGNTSCPGGDAIVGVSGNNTSAGYATSYLVVNSSGVIVAMNNTGIFQTLGASGLPAGTYTVYTYNVKTSVPLPIPAPSATAGAGLTTNINNIGSTFAGCYDVSNVGIPLVVSAAFPTAPIIGTISQGNQGGTSPFYYNTVTLTAYGGTLPYTFNWTNQGYVRYDVHYQMIDSNGDGTPDVQGAIITVFYADAAEWAVTVSDQTGCTGAGMTFSNLQTTGPTNSQLDIDEFTVTGSSSAAGNGSIGLTVTGGVASCANAPEDGNPANNNLYNYVWSGPNGYTNSFTDDSTVSLSGLPYGWYSVTVTDCSGQSTIGWYWVSRQRRGRQKTDDMADAVTVAPNPFDNETTIEFFVSETGRANVSVYAADGREVAVLFDETAEAEQVYELTLSAGNLPAGVYTVVLMTENGNVETRKVILAK